MRIPNLNHDTVTVMELTSENSKAKALLALALLVPVPTIGVALAMIFESTRGTPLGMGAYAASKIWILVLPLLWLWFADRGRVGFSPARQGGLMMGVALGAIIGAAIVGGYFVFAPLIDGSAMREAANRNGIGTPGSYLALVAYLAVFNSLLEEYVWRWFVFRKCEIVMGGIPAVIGSALFFSVHHFFALLPQAGLKVALLGTLGVFIGGGVWSWCYLRYRSIWPGYLSHVIADVAVFVVGWMILFGGGRV